MSWTFGEIERDWLAGSQIAVRPDIVVEAFNRCEQVVGREWIEHSRTMSGTVVQGSAPTLHVVVMGQRLVSLDGVGGAEMLIERLRRGDQSAQAELTAIYLLRCHPIILVELFPKILVDDKKREPDFRICQPDGPWIYVEVTKPDFSQAQRRAEKVLQRLISRLQTLKKSFALEVFLRHEPDELEFELVAQRVSQVCLAEGDLKEELPDGLGLLLLNHYPPGQIVVTDHPGEEKRPRIGAATAISGPNEPTRHIAVRMPFADERADQFLRGESKQLPKNSPSLIMLEMSEAMSGFKTWEPLLRRRFQPTLHTRVSAVCLFTSRVLVWTVEGQAWLPQIKLLVNPHAKLSLPSWISQALKEAGAGYGRLRTGRNN